MLTLALDIGTGLILLTTALSLLRLVIGPSLPDRVVALDMMTVAIVAFCGLTAIRFDEPAFLDVALALALVGFLATAALARFAERARKIHEKATS
ncbi:MAG TPA: pH regulation protein F [Rhodobacteraceae bacterium]|nr:pH regulation protein F [Paracoccaceae bacterium]